MNRSYLFKKVILFGLCLGLLACQSAPSLETYQSPIRHLYGHVFVLNDESLPAEALITITLLVKPSTGGELYPIAKHKFRVSERPYPYRFDMSYDKRKLSDSDETYWLSATASYYPQGHYQLAKLHPVELGSKLSASLLLQAQ
ncbi:MULTISPECIES: YbaY family lipoprotein [unclassified Vibrio]|uniref:YbaY family lipoprotein n=1 Tax=Vibrio sp. HB236076 TaxID=3232307 RepID=A0AB39H7K7_9VIBR|nr:YbaY family lipoprotein [Vibrio sp. HB161653]MDP5253810.1 YbaY family lipoprotein [Vibrio sp. HB161653]